MAVVGRIAEGVRTGTEPDEPAHRHRHRGTFTGVIAIDDATGDRFAVKIPSTPDDPSRGLLNGIGEIVGDGDAALSQVLPGTTTATNPGRAAGQSPDTRGLTCIV